MADLDHIETPARSAGPGCACGSPACPQSAVGRPIPAPPSVLAFRDSPDPDLADALDGFDGQACRGCGCTQHNACITQNGPCGWSESDLCTACVQVVARTFGAPAVRYLLTVGCHADASGSTTRPGADALTAAGVLDLRETLQRVLATCPAQGSGGDR